MVFVVVIHLFIYLFGFIFWMAGGFGDLQEKSSGFDTGKFLCYSPTMSILLLQCRKFSLVGFKIFVSQTVFLRVMM